MGTYAPMPGALTISSACQSAYYSVMSAGLRGRRSTVITTARPSRTLDSGARNRRYLITMGVRIACFLLAVAADGWARWVFLGGAAALPAIAVLLANAADLRRPLIAPPAESEATIQLSSPGTVPGTVEP